MSGWHNSQHEVQLTILCLLLLVLNPALTMASELAHIGKGMPENSKIDIHLLYNAYRERVKEGNDESRYSPGLTRDNSAVAVAEEGGLDSMKTMEEGTRKDLTEKYNKVIEGLKAVSQMPLEANTQGIEQQSTFVKQDFKAPEETPGKEQNPKTVKINPKIKSTVILKMDLPATMNVESFNLKAQSNSSPQDSPEQRVAELNRVFKEFVSVWKKPTADPAHPYFLGSPNTDYASKPVHLNALNDLMNVVDNLKQPDTIDNFVKAINDEMMRDTDIVSSVNCLSFVDNLEKQLQNQNAEQAVLNPILKDSHVESSQDYDDAEVKSEDLVSTNKLTSNDNPAKPNGYQEKVDSKVITDYQEQSSRISKRVATDSKSVKEKSGVAKSAKARRTATKSVKDKSTGGKAAEARSTKSKSSDAKSSEEKYCPEKTSKVAEGNSIEKALKLKSADAKVAEAKPVSTESVKTKTAEVKPVEVKPTEQKSAEAKIADSKCADSKCAAAKSAEAKLNEVKKAKLKAIEAKSGDSKSTDAKSGETPQIKSGGLYEEYKQKLQEILAATQNQRKFVSKGENSGRADSQCHCDERRTLTLAVGTDGATISNSPVQCHCEASKHPTYADGTPAKLSNAPVACHCDSQTCSALETVGIIHPKVVANKVLFAQRKKEGMNYEGPKPYYISNSKQRQMVWNDIPLSGEKRHYDNAIKKTDNMKYAQHGLTPPAVALKPKLEPHRPPSQRNRPDTQSKKHTQLQYLVRVLQDRHRSPALRKTKKRNLSRRSDEMNRLAALFRRAKKRDLFGGLDVNNRLTNQPSFPQVFVTPPAPVQPNANSGKMIGMMAKQLNVSPMEMVQRIASTTGSDAVPIIDNPVPFNSASQTNGFQVPNDSANIKPAPQITFNSQANQANLGAVLDKILTRLQTIQDLNLNRELEDWNSQGVPCCFAEPSDGSPCDLVGSWESLLLGVRINIKDERKPLANSGKKPLCYRPVWHGSSSTRKKRQCVKLSPEEMKNRHSAGQTVPLNVTLEETVPPREHTIIDNLSNWVITAHSISTLGGPITFSCRKMNTKLMATFVGFCRNCGCIDTIFGSWSFIHPSRDCQDITMSILERRDIMRRYSLIDARRERFKEQLFKKSSWAKTEKEQEQQVNTKKKNNGGF